MGTWRIEIDGCGCHDNADATIDADIASKEFVAKLQDQGHEIERARFILTDGAGRDLKPE
jgi:hypothetical protein